MLARGHCKKDSLYSPACLDLSESRLIFLLIIFIIFVHMLWRLSQLVEAYGTLFFGVLPSIDITPSVFIKVWDDEIRDENSTAQLSLDKDKK